jgi:hypothetical protein
MALRSREDEADVDLGVWGLRSRRWGWEDGVN